jgi:hypothetical protein
LQSINPSNFGLAGPVSREPGESYAESTLIPYSDTRLFNAATVRRSDSSLY